MRKLYPALILALIVSLSLCSVAYAISPPTGGSWRTVKVLNFVSSDIDYINLTASTTGTSIFGGQLVQTKTSGASHSVKFNYTEATFIKEQMNTTENTAYLIKWKFKTSSDNITSFKIVFEWDGSTDGYYATVDTAIRISWYNGTTISYNSDASIADILDGEYHTLALAVGASAITCELDNNSTKSITVYDSKFRGGGQIFIQELAIENYVVYTDTLSFSIAETSALVELTPYVVTLVIVSAIIGIITVKMKEA